MKNLKIRWIAILLLFSFITSCTNNSSSDISSDKSEDKDPYEIMEVAFEDSPEAAKIRPLLESVMNSYNLPITDENRLKVASMLVSLRKESVLGITEMEILKHIYQYGIKSISLPEQAAISVVYLEKNK